MVMKIIFVLFFGIGKKLYLSVIIRFVSLLVMVVRVWRVLFVWVSCKVK